MRAWNGSGNNDASNPDYWSPTGVPQPGDNLVITQGTMKVYGNALAGDTLSVAAPPGRHPSKLMRAREQGSISTHRSAAVCSPLLTCMFMVE
jgi:hypothetical protein